MVCTDMKIWLQYDQNFQGLSTSIPMCPKKSERKKLLLVAKLKKYGFHIIRKPNDQWFH